MCNLTSVHPSVTTYLYRDHMNSLSPSYGGGEAKWVYRGKCKRYDLKLKYWIIFLYLAPRTEPTIEQKLSKYLKKERSSPHSSNTGKKTNFQGTKWRVRLTTRKIGNTHSTSRATVKGSAFHLQNCEPPSLHATQIQRAGQTRHSKPILFLYPPNTYCFVFNDPLTKIAKYSY